MKKVRKGSLGGVNYWASAAVLGLKRMSRNTIKHRDKHLYRLKCTARQGRISSPIREMRNGPQQVVDNP